MGLDCLFNARSAYYNIYGALTMLMAIYKQAILSKKSFPY